jgi:two-component system, NtrC family, sensor histidine kinase HydH
MPIPNAYTVLKSLIHLSTSSLPIEAKLEQIFQSLSAALEADRCFLLGPEEISKNEILSSLVSKKKPLWVDEASPLGDGENLFRVQGLLCPAFTCLPLYVNDNSSLKELLYIGFSKERRFSDEETDFLLLIAKEIGAAIQNNFLQSESNRAISDLTALHEMDRMISSTLKLKELLSLSLANGVEVLKAGGGVLRLEDPKTKELKIRCGFGDDHQLSFDERISREVFSSQTPLSLDGSGEPESYSSLLCAPLISKKRRLGTLTFYRKKGILKKFDEKDFQLLLTMANHISCSIENALAHDGISNLAREHEKRLKQLSSLWELNKSLLTTIHFEQILQLTLTAITIGDGLGFNRAMLFMVDPKEHLLKGIMAVGPDSPEEAGRIWSDLAQRKGSPSDVITQIPFSSHKDSVLNTLIQGIRIPLDQEQCILSRTALEGKPFNIRLPQNKEEWLRTPCERGCHLGSEVGCYMGEQLSRTPKVYSFATMPLWGKGKVIGVILVDNLYNQNAITEEDLHFLGMFSNQAGLAIENAILYRNLEDIHQELKNAQTLLIHHEKMAALGELSTNIAHEIRNPLVSIGGFARRLDRTIADETPEKRYARTIVKEVGRLEKILDDILLYTGNGAIQFQALDIKEILEDSLSLMSGEIQTNGIDLVKEFADGLPPVSGDCHLLRQVFYNLVSNACQSIDGRGRISIRIQSHSQDGSSWVRVEVEDTGKGIDPENLHNIFNPFYTTKDSNLGVGLSILHKIVSSHQGQIEVDNHPGKGVKFIVTLPAWSKSEKNQAGRNCLGGKSIASHV